MAKEKKTEETDGAVVRESGIIVNDAPIQVRELPLIVTLPPTANKAQIERAKVLNAYAYQQPKGWMQKKDRLLKELEDLKDSPVPAANPFGGKISVGSPVPILPV